MPKSLSPDQVKRILESGEFAALIGSIEDETLECKKAPYQLDQKRYKLELAKDVTALANARGGFILLGVRTEKNVTLLIGDEVKEVSPFPRNLVDLERYMAVLKSLVYPQLERVEINWFPSVKDSDRGDCGNLYIPSASSSLAFSYN